MLLPPLRTVRRLLATTVASSVMVGGTLIGLSQSPAAAAVTSVRGYACGYITNVGLFGGPPGKLGCDPQIGTAQITASSSSLAPSVTLPSSGSSSAVTATDSDGAKAVYGPAVIFGGEWPCDDTNCPAASPASGPMSVSTQGTPSGGTVTSSSDIVTYAAPQPVVACYTPWVNGTNGYTPHPGATCYNPGGYGPYPVSGDELHVSCSASQSGVSGSTTLKNSILATTTDGNGDPKAQEPVPNNPPVNYTRSGVITNVGDVFTVVYNEQIHNADGSLTVNGAHMYLFGPTAVGEVIKGQVTCGVTPPASASVDNVPPTCGTAVVEPNGPTDPTPQSPRKELVGVFDAGLGRDQRIVGDGGTATGSTTLTSASANFSSADVGAAVGGSTIYGGATITAVTNSTTALMSNGATGTTTAGTVTITRQKGLHAISNIKVQNGTVQVGDPPSSTTQQNRVFTVDQTWPLFLTATRTSSAETAGLPMVWSFDATDAAGNVTHCRGILPAATADFDHDARTDISLFRSGGASWYVHHSTGDPDTGTAYGTSTDIQVPGDYDGDGQVDIAIFRPSTGLWAIHLSTTGTDRLVTYGVGTDIPVPGDYDGDGITDIAVYRPSTGTWFWNRSSDHVDAAVTFGGVSGDVAIPADYDGDGKTDVAIFRPSNGSWYVHPSGGGPDTALGWGTNGDIPVLGDYDGDGKADRAIFRPSTGLWAINKSSGGSTSVTYGVGTDIPVPGDYDGDRMTDIAVFRPSLGAWYMRSTRNGTDTVVTFGISGDRPMAIPPSIRLAFFP